MMTPSVLIKALGVLCLFMPLAAAQACQTSETIKPSSSVFEVSTTMKDCYTPGSTDTVAFNIAPGTADLTAPEAVVVFDIVGNDEGDAFPSKTMQVLDVNALSVTPDIFRDSLEMSVVQAGLQGEISFEMRNNAPPGSYTMVISIFRLAEGLRPRDVTSDPGALAGRVFYKFRIE